MVLRAGWSCGFLSIFVDWRFSEARAVVADSVSPCERRGRPPLVVPSDLGSSLLL